MGERSVAYTTLKMAVLAPIPRMSARRATEVKPGFLRSSLRPKRTLRAKFAMLVPPIAPDDHFVGEFRRFVGRIVTNRREILTILVELTRQGFRGSETPGGFESAAQRRLSDSFQAHVRAASAAPSTSAGVEDGGLGFDEHLLLDGREFDHGPAILRVAEGCEDLSGHAKIRMVHVGALLGFGQAQGQAAKVVGGHGVASFEGDSTSKCRPIIRSQQLIGILCYRAGLEDGED